MKKKLPLLILVILAVVAIVFAIMNLNSKNKNNIDETDTEELLVRDEKEIIENSTNERNNNNQNIEKVDKQLNITILLDLSDRIAQITNENGIELKKDFNPKERDLEIINSILNILKDDAKKGSSSGKEKLINLKSKIKMLCIPKPQNAQINFDELNIDFSDKKYNGSNSNLIQKNKQFSNLASKTEILSSIYDKILLNKNFPGSDIWKFFEQYVKSYCIDKNYRNILVIFTDGYIYHEDSIYKEKNRYSYITGNILNKYNFRDKNLTLDSIKQKISKEDFGLITRTANLQDLEVLVVEILPNKKCKFDGYVISEVLKKWFKEMGINHSDILLSSEDKNLTSSRIKEFFDYVPE